MIISANNADLSSWITVPKGSDFPIQNIPFGICTILNTENSSKRVVTIIGHTVIDIAQLGRLGYLKDCNIDPSALESDTLNALMKSNKEGTRTLRNRISALLASDNPELRDYSTHHSQVLYDYDTVTMHIPVEIGDYTDFYSSKEHATNVGKMFRDPDNALLPNWLHLPVGYHGRSSSIVVSGKEIKRPWGQIMPKEASMPVFMPSKSIDFELEMGFITYDANVLGERISTHDAEDHIFGLCLFNDWSARDIQKWEYIPLGIFG